MKKRLLTIIVCLALGGALIFFASKITNNKYSFKTNVPTPTTYSLPTTTLFFGGDIMLSRNVAANIYKTQDYSLPFRNIADQIKSTDIAFANLESPFNDHGDHSVEGSLVFNADPKSVEGLKLAGFDILSTANNHSL